MGAIVNGLDAAAASARSAPTFLIFSDYMKGVDPARRDHAHPVDLRVHARLDRPRRGRPDPPADRAARDAARDAEPRRRAARRASTRPRWRGATRCSQTDTPTVLALSRQGLPVWDPAGVPDDAIERGAYVLHDSAGGEPELILMAHRLRGPHRATTPRSCSRPTASRVRLVSMPCLDRFAEQDQAYRDSVLPPAVRARVAVEAAEPARLAPLGRRRRRRRRRWRASAPPRPAKVLYEHFGFTRRGDRRARRARCWTRTRHERHRRSTSGSRR